MLSTELDAPTSARGKRILLCDDDPDITAVLKEGLIDAGFAVDAFNDAKLVLSQFQEGRYSLVILDEVMPGIDGIVLYQLVRRKDSKAKILFLTSYETAVKRALPDLDRKFILEKPVAIRHLVQVAREAIGS